MEVEGSHSIRAPRGAVVAALADPEKLRESLPGCESVEIIGPGEAKATVVVAIGDFEAKFTGTVKVAGDGPWAVRGSGRGHPAGSIKGEAEVTIADAGNATALSYRGSVEPGGKLGEVDATALAAFGRELVLEFLANIEAVARRSSDWVDELDHTMAGVQLGDEPSEDAVIDKAYVAGEAAEDIEERLEVAAGQSYLGGPLVWGLIAVIVLIVILAIAS